MASTDNSKVDHDLAQESQQQMQSLNDTAEQQTQAGDGVEMTQLATHPTIATETDQPAEKPADSSTTVPEAASSATSDPAQPSDPPKPAPIARSETAEFALGPEGATLPAQHTDSPDAVLRITLMLTTGARHPYLISNKYLTARKVQAIDAQGNFDPREMSAYKLKELIWTDWRPEWEPKPRDPAAIRLIILGRMLEDKSQLRESPFSLSEPNVVHMTVKPADYLDDDADTSGKAIAKSLRGRNTSDGESAGCCRCIIQ